MQLGSRLGLGAAQSATRNSHRMEDRFGDCAAVFEETKLVMIAPPVVASSTDIYDAVVALSRSIAGRSDLESLLSGVGESLRRVVGFDCVGLALHDPKGNRMQDHILRESGTPVASICLQVDQDPAGWVWLNQQPLVIASLAAETR